MVAHDGIHHWEAETEGKLQVQGQPAFIVTNDKTKPKINKTQ